MYAACLFCNGHLGRNEALEHFQVGRRLAYDAAKGRLWVICRRCERWNLTPLETRWEAIEEAERAFRATRLRVSTDNIGLAQLREGLELVRVGASPQLELAGWRYGDQFGRRRRKYIALSAGAIALAGAPFLGIFTGVALVGTTASLLHSAAISLHSWRVKRVPRVCVKDGTGAALYLTRENIHGMALVPAREAQTWRLRVPHIERRLPGGSRDPRTNPGGKFPAPPDAMLRGAAAHRALAQVFPYVNAAGGSARRVRNAVDLIGASSSLDQLLYAASTVRHYNNARPGENSVATLHPRMRLALEMVLHENDERRAMEGELLELEARWREAEEIAGIADSLLLPPEIDARLDALRRRATKQ